MFLAAVAVLLAWVYSRFRWPLRPCPRCKGKGTNRGSNRKRYGRCRKCKGTKQVRRVGATAVHRFWWTVLGAAMKGRMKDKVDKAKQKAGWPE